MEKVLSWKSRTWKNFLIYRVIITDFDSKNLYTEILEILNDSGMGWEEIRGFFYLYFENFS